jgi:lysophospholipase L1-like esterase
MFAKIRYWHKPNIKKLYFWFPENDNGKDYIRFNTVYSEKLFNSLKNIGAKHLSIAEFDKYGFRKTHIKNNKKLNNILMLGDSFTEGVWVNDKENFTYFLCKKLYDENNGYVINAGVNGYGILEEFFILKKFYKKFNIKKVVLNVFVNDIENKIVEVLTGRLYNIKIKWEKYFDWLKQFNDFCLKNKIRFYLSVIPAKQQYILKNNTYENYQIMIKNFCLNNNIKFLDVYNEFTKYNADDIYIKYDDHFNIKGHKLYSEFLYKNIKD